MMFTTNHGMWNFLIFGMAIILFIAIYVAQDAAKFGENGLLWALVVFFMPMMGILVYLIVRSSWTRTGYNSHQQTSPPRVEQVRAPVTGDRTTVDKEMAASGTYFCTACGSENNSAATYCNSCGAQILERSQ